MSRIICVMFFAGACTRCLALPVPMVGPSTHFTQARELRAMVLLTGYDAIAFRQMEMALCDPFNPAWRPLTDHIRPVGAFNQIPDPLALAQRLALEGNSKAAREIYRELIKLTPENMDVRHALIQLCLDDPLEFHNGVRELVSALTASFDYWRGWMGAAQVTLKLLLEISSQEESQQVIPLNLLQFFIVTLQERPALLADRQRDQIRKLNDLLLSSPNSIEVRPALVILLTSFMHKAIEIAPANAEVYKAVATINQMLWANLGHPAVYAQAAIDASLRAMELAPYDSHALVLAGHGHAMRARSIEAAEDQPELQKEKKELFLSSISFFRRALTLDPVRLDATDQMARCYVEAGMIDEGVKFMDELAARLTRAREIGHALTRKALILTLAKQHDKAEEVLLDVTKQFPTHLEPYYMLLEIYAHQENSEKRMSLLMQVVQNMPTFLNARISLAAAYEEAGDLQKAEEHYLAAVRLYRDDNFMLLREGDSREQSVMIVMHSALSRLASLYERRGEFLKASDLLSHHRSLYYQTDDQGKTLLDRRNNPIPRTPVDIPAEAAVRAAMTYYAGKQTQKAIDSLIEAMRIKGGKYYSAQRMLLDIYHLRIQRKAIDADPNQHNEKLQYLAKALALCRLLEAERPADAEIKYQTARLQLIIVERSIEQMQDIQNKRAEHTFAAEAIAVLDSLITREPRNIVALMLRAKAYELIGDADKARRDAQAVMELDASAAVAPQPAEEEKNIHQPLSPEEISFCRSIVMSLMVRLHLAEKQPDFDKAEELARQSFRAAVEATRAAIKGGVSVHYRQLYDDAMSQSSESLAWVLYKKALLESDQARRNALLMEADSIASSNLREATARLLYRVAMIRAAREMDADQRKVVRKYLKDMLADNPALPEAPHAFEVLQSFRTD